MKVCINPKAGFSLIELLAVVAISAILSVVTVQLAVSSQLRSSQSDSVSKVRQEGDFLLDQLSYSIRNARSVTCVGTDRLDVAMKNNTSIIYQLDEMQLASNSAYLNSTSVEMTDLLFTCTENDASPGVLVNISFTLTNRATAPPSVQDFTTNVYLRSFQ